MIHEQNQILRDSSYSQRRETFSRSSFVISTQRDARKELNRSANRNICGECSRNLQTQVFHILTYHLFPRIIRHTLRAAWCNLHNPFLRTLNRLDKLNRCFVSTRVFNFSRRDN